VIFLGDGGCTKEDEIKKQLQELDKNKYIIVTGDYPGVEKIAYKQAKKLGFETRMIKTDWSLGKEKAKVKRNHRLVEKCDPKHVFLFHNYIQNSRFTKNMMDICLLDGIPFTLNKSTK
jgi:hypothetical protein